LAQRRWPLERLDPVPDGGYSHVSIQGPAAALRELAAALVDAAAQADQAEEAEEAEQPEPVVGVGS
jgi:hypothetical protein